jgi:hypothetical protein
VGFFYLESLWNLGPEPLEERQALLARLFAAPASRLLRQPAPQPAPQLQRQPEPQPLDPSLMQRPVQPVPSHQIPAGPELDAQGMPLTRQQPLPQPEFLDLPGLPPLPPARATPALPALPALP